MLRIAYPGTRAFSPVCCFITTRFGRCCAAAYNLVAMTQASPLVAPRAGRPDRLALSFLVACALLSVPLVFTGSLPLWLTVAAVVGIDRSFRLAGSCHAHLPARHGGRLAQRAGAAAAAGGSVGQPRRGSKLADGRQGHRRLWPVLRAGRAGRQPLDRSAALAVSGRGRAGRRGCAGRHPLVHLQAALRARPDLRRPAVAVVQQPAGRVSPQPGRRVDGVALPAGAGAGGLEPRRTAAGRGGRRRAADRAGAFPDAIARRVGWCWRPGC